MNKFFLIIGILGLLFIGFLTASIYLVGDRYCLIDIKNNGPERLIIKTFKYSTYDNRLTVDSVVLQQYEKLEIGHCINCSTPDSMDLDFDAIGYYDKNKNFKFMRRTELIDHLETKDKEDCITYLLEIK